MFQKYILPKNKVDIFFQEAKKIKGFKYSAEKDILTFGQKKDISLSRETLLTNYSVLIFKVDLETGKLEEEKDAAKRISLIMGKIAKKGLKTSYIKIDNNSIKEIINLVEKNKVLTEFFKTF